MASERNGTLTPTRTTRVSVAPALLVARIAKEAHLITLEPITKGSVILRLEGEIRATPNRYSVQISANQHLYPPDSFDELDRRYAWRFLNHSCVPNAAFEGKNLVALKRIRAGDEVTFNYNATEAEVSSPFHCRCGHCDGGLVRGYKHSR
jgi:hypothetical protein